jgi:hypothetical protein
MLNETGIDENAIGSISKKPLINWYHWVLAIVVIVDSSTLWPRCGLYLKCSLNRRCLQGSEVSEDVRHIFMWGKRFKKKKKFNLFCKREVHWDSDGRNRRYTQDDREHCAICDVKIVEENVLFVNEFVVNASDCFEYSWDWEIECSQREVMHDTRH